MTDTTSAPAEVLSLSYFSADLNQDITVQGYLLRLLSDLWRKEDEFNSKRPFGNSGWQWEVYGALIEAGHMPGELDADGCIVDFDERAGEALVLSLIGQMGTAVQEAKRLREAFVQLEATCVFEMEQTDSRKEAANWLVCRNAARAALAGGGS